MNSNLMLAVIRFCAVIVLLGCASWAAAVPGPPSSNYHSVAAMVENAGNSIQGDGGVYTDGAEGVAARIWDFGSGDSGVADHLHFSVEQKFANRYLKLVIADLGVDAVCRVGRFKPNESSINFEFYAELAPGESTSGPENYGGTFKCTTDTSGKTGWFVHWDSADQCIVISHNPDGTWTFTSGVGCLADVSQIVNGTVKPPLGAYDVPFQVVATELP